MMGRYSLSPAASKRSFSAFFTDGKTYGLPLSSRCLVNCIQAGQYKSRT